MDVPHTIASLTPRRLSLCPDTAAPKKDYNIHVDKKVMLPRKLLRDCSKQARLYQDAVDFDTMPKKTPSSTIHRKKKKT